MAGENIQPGPVCPPEKEDRVLKILDRWVTGEISSDQADRELQITGVKLPETSEGV